MLELLEYYILKWRPKLWWVRMSILFFVATFIPITISSLLMAKGFTPVQAGERTFIICIPVAAWLMHKINERWHSDED